MDLATFRWLLTDDGQRLIEAAATAYADHDGDPVGAATALRGTERGGGPRPAGGRAHPGAAAGAGGAEAGRGRAADVLHPRRARAGDPRPGRRAPGGPAGGRRRRLGDRPRLRHRRRPGRVRPRGAHHRRRGRRPGPGGRRVGQPRRPRPRRRGAGRGRHDARPRGLRRGVRRPGAPLADADASSTPTAGRPRGRSWPGCSAPPRRQRREGRARASRTPWCPTTSRRSG